jgi:hypothetical protein
MNTMTKIFFSFIIISTLVGCAWTDDNESIKIVGSYNIAWNDLQSNRGIYKNVNSCSGCSEIIVENYVFSTGTKGKYIFAKQQTISTPLKTNYFIIDTLENINTQKGVYGPLDKIEFESLAKKIGLKKVIFNKHFPKLK